MSLSSGIHLVLGGARSGKSRYAESIASDLENQESASVVYVATARSLDGEMEDRILQHQKDRPSKWLTVEEPLNLNTVLETVVQEVVLIDCLTLWLMNAMEDVDGMPRLIDEFLEQLEKTSKTVIIVSNEISMGVVPMGELSRRYVDELGRLHQKVGAIANRVTLMVAGIPHAIKSEN